MERASKLYGQFTRFLNLLAPAGDLAIRLWIANVFFKSGLTKLANWDGTLALFANEYQVPLLSPTLAAYAGTATELIFPDRKSVV